MEHLGLYDNDEHMGYFESYEPEDDDYTYSSKDVYALKAHPHLIFVALSPDDFTLAAVFSAETFALLRIYPCFWSTWESEGVNYFNTAEGLFRTRLSPDNEPDRMMISKLNAATLEFEDLLPEPVVTPLFKTEEMVATGGRLFFYCNEQRLRFLVVSYADPREGARHVQWTFPSACPYIYVINRGTGLVTDVLHRDGAVTVVVTKGDLTEEAALTEEFAYALPKEFQSAKLLWCEFLGFFQNIFNSTVITYNKDNQVVHCTAILSLFLTLHAYSTSLSSPFISSPLTAVRATGAVRATLSVRTERPSSCPSAA